MSHDNLDEDDKGSSKTCQLLDKCDGEETSPPVHRSTKDKESNKIYASPSLKRFGEKNRKKVLGGVLETVLLGIIFRCMPMYLGS